MDTNVSRWKLHRNAQKVELICLWYQKYCLDREVFWKGDCKRITSLAREMCRLPLRVFLPLHSFCSVTITIQLRSENIQKPGVATRRRGPTVRRLRRRVNWCSCCYSPPQVILLTILQQSCSPIHTGTCLLLPLLLPSNCSVVLSTTARERGLFVLIRNQ